MMHDSSEPLVMTSAVSAGYIIADATGIEPWWFAAIVVPLGGFIWWREQRAAKREDERIGREVDAAKRAEERSVKEQERREEREDKRLDLSEQQTAALRECAQLLHTLNAQHEQQAATLAAIPQRVVDLIKQNP